MHPGWSRELLDGLVLTSNRMQSRYSEARTRRRQLRHYMAEEVLADKELLKLTRLCGINLITLYGLFSAIGDIKRFESARNCALTSA